VSRKVVKWESCSFLLFLPHTTNNNKKLKTKAKSTQKGQRKAAAHKCPQTPVILLGSFKERRKGGNLGNELEF
jgi:cell division septation protein DedD